MRIIEKKRNSSEADKQWDDTRIGDLVEVHIRDRTYMGVRTKLPQESCIECVFGRNTSGYKHCCWFTGHRCRYVAEVEEDIG